MPTDYSISNYREITADVSYAGSGIPFDLECALHDSLNVRIRLWDTYVRQRWEPSADLIAPREVSVWVPDDQYVDSFRAWAFTDGAEFVLDFKLVAARREESGTRLTYEVV